jgi:hypothetical protein
MIREEKPISSPGDVSGHGSETPHVNGDVGKMTEAHHVLHRNLPVGVQRGANGTDRSFDAMFPWADSPQMCERRDNTDRAVSAHAQIPDVIEENYAGCGAGVSRVDQ